MWQVRTTGLSPGSGDGRYFRGRERGPVNWVASYAIDQNGNEEACFALYMIWGRICSDTEHLTYLSEISK